MENANFTLSDEINGPLLAAAIGIVTIVALLTNSFVLLLTLCHFKTWKQPSNIFLTNMLLSNLLISVFLMPLCVVTCAIGEWVFGDTVAQKLKVCQATAYVFLYNLIVETESLTLISLDRLFFIVKSMEYHKYMSTNKAVIIVVLSWLLGAILSTPPFYGLGKFEFAESYGICVPGFEGQLGFSIYLFLILLSLGGIIVFSSTWTFCYTRNYLKRRNSRKMARNSVYLSQKRKLIGLFGTLVVIHILCYSLMVSLAAVGPFTVVPPQWYAAAFFMLLLMTNLSPLAQSYFRYEIRNFVHSLFIKIGILKLQASTLVQQESTGPTELSSPTETRGRDIIQSTNRQFLNGETESDKHA